MFHVEQKHAESYKKMQKAIKQRNRSIKNGESESAVRSWDALISTEGEKVTEHRNLFVRGLQEEIDALDKKILKKAKGYYGARSKLYKTAKQAVIKAGQYAYRDRRQRKRQFRA